MYYLCLGNYESTILFDFDYNKRRKMCIPSPSQIHDFGMQRPVAHLKNIYLFKKKPGIYTL